MVVHIITTGHDKVEISSRTFVLVASHPMNLLKYVKLSQASQISERSFMLQYVVKITLNLIIIIIILCSRVCTYVCMG
jgi:hypothetical protein